MRLRNSSLIPTVDTVDRSSTEIKDPPVVSVDGDQPTRGGAAADTVRRGANPPQPSEPSVVVPNVAPYFAADAGALLEMSVGEASTPATPDLNWLIALGER